MFALFAMALIGIGDAINKKARQENIPIASYLLIQSPFFLLTILLVVLLSTGIKVSTTDILYSALGAIFSFAAFTLMLHSLTYGYAGINYAIFRLSFVFSSAAAIIYWHEKLTTGKFMGIGLAIFALLLFFYRPKSQTILKKSVTSAIFAMLLNACFQLILKSSTHVFSSPSSFLLMMSLFFCVMVIIYNIFSGNPQIPRKTFLYAPVNGMLMALGSLFMIIALSHGNLSTVAPIVQLSFLVTLFMAIVFLNEKIDPIRIIGMISAITAIILLGR